jgi:Na+/H+ antiporter NhaD/arsenite permease-like protein
MSEKTAIATAIFILTYVLITVQKIPGIKLDRPAGVSIGAMLMVLTGVITLEEAYGFIDLNTISFLLGMMILISYLKLSGFFEFMAFWIVKLSKTTSRMLLLIVFSSGVLSALFVNDTVCLLFTPIILSATRSTQTNPIPFLIAVATASNIGSVATITGNPQNMFIGVRSGIPFTSFLAKMLPIGVVGLLLNYFILRLIYGKEINQKPLFTHGIRKPLVDKILVIKSLSTLLFVFGLFVYGVFYPLAALIGGALILLIGAIEPSLAFREVNWTLLLFFSALFVVMGGVEKAGVGEILLDRAFPILKYHSWKSVFVISTLVLVLSNLVSNVPAVMLFAPYVDIAPDPQKVWLILAMSSTLAGNLTLVGSIANLIVAEIAKEGGVTIRFMEYLKVGMPLTLITTIAGILWLLIA